MEIKASLKYLNIAPRKTRAVADLIRNMDVTQAMAELRFQKRRPAHPIFKLIKSAVSSAKNNFHIEDEDALYIKSIKVDQGPMLKRFLPRAMGRATPIHKTMSHIELVLGAREVVKKKKKKVELFRPELKASQERKKKPADFGEPAEIKEKEVKTDKKAFIKKGWENTANSSWRIIY